MKNKIISIDVYESLLVIVFDSKKKILLNLKTLRTNCPCAFCSGEQDVFGNTYKGKLKKLKKEAFSVHSFSFVGLYGLKIVWGDGHSDGIFTLNFLNKLGSTNEKQ